MKSQNHCSPPAGATKVRDGNGTDGRSQAFDAVLRKRRNLAQRVFSKLKQLSAIAARFDEPASRYRSGLPLASLHGFVTTTSQTQAMNARTERSDRCTTTTQPTGHPHLLGDLKLFAPITMCALVTQRHRWERWPNFLWST